MNIEKLTDSQLNSVLIEWRYGSGDKDIEKAKARGKLNFLKDWNLAMDVFKTHGSIIKRDDFGWIAGGYYSGSIKIEVSNKSAIRAVCEYLAYISITDR